MKDLIKEFNEEIQTSLDDIAYFKSKGDHITAKILEDAHNIWVKEKTEF